jgi:plasmid stability protein
MATITLKDVPEELRLSLKKRAERNRRSLNQELLYCLERIIENDAAASNERKGWLKASEQGLMATWDNAEDNVYNELLQK